MEPLAVAFVWNREDDKTVREYVDYSSGLLSRDLEMPYSRTIDLPIFFYRNREDEKIPPEIKLKARKVIVYIFIGENSVATDGWDTYVRKLQEIENVRLIPIALDAYAFDLDDSIAKNNFIRLYDMKLCKKQELFIAIAHEIYRCGFNDKNVCMDSEDSALKIFISHAKDNIRTSEKNEITTEATGKTDGSGLTLAKQLKNLIDETSMKRFFDSADIAPGYRFDDEIRRNIDEASMVVINSDIYSSRYWCQREVQQAKKDGRPVVEVDIIDSGVDRKLPFAGNIPVIRVDMEDGCAEQTDLLRILEAVLIESIRYNYAAEKLSYEQESIPENVKMICRPPEMMDLEDILEKTDGERLSVKCANIMYPDPPVYSEEIEFFEKNGIRVFTPIEAPYEGEFLTGESIGISVSEADERELALYGQTDSHTRYLSMMIANYVLGRGATLVYGGDLRENGYTEQLILAASALRDRLQTKDIHLKNYIAWPIYLNDDKMLKQWKARNRKVLEMVEVAIDEKAAELLDSTSRAVPPDTVTHRYIWSRSLTKMRREMITECSARICAGGRIRGFKGKMPGVLEEILIAAELKRPIYLLGGFGGVVGSVCRTIESGRLSVELSQGWQLDNNDGYEELLECYRNDGDSTGYEKLEKVLTSLQLNNGLSDEENRVLFTTVYVDEALRLVLKGLQSLNK